MQQTLAEARVTGINPSHAKTDAKIAARLILRYVAWLNARMRCAVYEGGRWLPGWRDPLNQMFDQATVAGKLLSSPTTANDPRVAEFLHSAHKQPAVVYAKFVQEAHTPQWVQPKHPDLDEWLIMIWPMLDYHAWTCTDVISIAVTRFPHLAGHYPLTSGEDLGKHIRLSLNKHLRGFGSTPSIGLTLPRPGKRAPHNLPAALVKLARHIQK